MKNLFQLDGEVAVVTGGTGELGGLMAEALAAFGAKVALLGRNEDRGRARALRIADSGGIAQFYSADVMNRQDLETFAIPWPQNWVRHRF